MGGELHGWQSVFKRRLALSVAALIAAGNNFVPQLKCVIAKVLKCTVHLKTIYKCKCVP